MKSASESSVVTDVVSSVIKPGNERNFDEWFKRFLDLQKKARADHRPVQELFVLFLLEAFLDRLSRSRHAD